MTTYSPISYDQIVANIRADAEKIAAGRQYQQEASEPVTAPSFDEYARGLGYDGVDYEGKENIKRSWLNQHGQAWRQAGANPEDDLAKYAQTIKPVRSAFDTDWLDLAKQAANRSISGISNVIANELPSGYFKEGFQKQGAEYAGYARENAANFSDVTKDRLAREAREQREVEAAGGGELGAAALTARHVSERPIATLAQAAGSMVTQLPGLALQGTGGALAATGVGVAPGAGLVTAGRALNTVTSAASVAGEVGQGAYDMVMNLPISKVQNHPEFVRALTDAKSLKLSDSEAQLVAHRAVASMAMSEGSKYGLGIGAASGAISGGFGAGRIAEEAGKKVAGAFLKRAGIELVSEGTEEAVGQVAQNKAANSGGASIPLQKGTGSAFVEGAAGGLGLAGAGAVVGKTASTVVDKALDIATRPNVKPTNKGELMDKVSTGMPQYLQEAASDLIDTIIANPNPTPEMQAEIDASKAQLVSMGMTEADIDGLFAENVTPDPLVNVPSYTDGPAKDVMVGSYKPAETGGRPGTEAPTRLVTELAKEGELTLEAVNNVAGQHEKSYETWVVQTQSQPSRVPTQEFISGTADNMVVTALNLGLPMDAELRTYAEAKAAELAATQDTDPNNLGSRLMADGETLMSESQYQATQMGTAENLIGEYVLYGNAEGYVVQRPNGLYVVDTRPGNTQDIFIESGLSGQSPASIGLKLMAPPKITVPKSTKGQTPAQLVAEAQLTYEQIKLNDALDLLVLSMSATEAEAFLEALDQRLANNVTPGQVAQEIENEINKVLSTDGADSGAVSSQDVTTSDAPSGFVQSAGSSGLNTSPSSDSAPAAEVEVWTTGSAIERITQWLQANGGTGQIRPDVRILDKLPGFVTGELQQGVDAGELRMLGPGGVPVDSVEKMAVFGARRKDTSYLFPANTPVDVDPVRVLIHETWHKYQNADTVLRLHELLDRWSQSPVDSIQYKAWVRGEEVIAAGSDLTGGMHERIPKILDFLWENGVRPDQRTGVARWMDTAIAAVRHVMRHILGKDMGWTAAELMTFAQKMVLDDSNGKEATQYLGEKTKAARHEAKVKATKEAALQARIERGGEGGGANFSTADIAKLSDRGVPLKEFAQQFAGDIKQKDRDVADADKIALDYFDQVIKDPMSVLPLVKGSSLSYKQYLRMPDGLDYDPQNINHITATDLTKSIYAAVKSGRIEAALEGEAKAANESRARDLQSLARYLKGNQEYRTTEAAVMLKAASKWGMRLSTNNDQATVELVEITNKNATAIAVLGGLDAAALSEQMRAGKPLKTAFRDALQQTVDARERAAKASGKDGWVVYKKSDKHEDAVALRDGCAGREWCTAGAVSTAAMQLRQGDFHVFYRDGQPVVALRTVNGRLGEAPRGSLSGQGLTDFERGVAERRLRGQPEPIKSKNLPVPPTQPTVSGGEDFLDDQKVLADIQSGAIENYSDYALFTLQAYKMKAGDYSGETLPGAALAIVKDAIQKRDPSVKSWQAKGYWHAEDLLTKDDLQGIKVLVGDIDDVQRTLVTWEDFSAPELLDLRINGLAADVDLILDAPKLLRADEISLKIGSNVPNLQEVGTLKTSTKVSIPKLSVVGPGTLFSIYAPSTIQTSYPYLLSLLPETQFILRDRVPGVGYDLRKIFPSAAMGGEMDFHGFDSQIKAFGDPGKAPPALPKVDVESILTPTQIAPVVEGGEDFLDDQKVLADIQSGAIKQYSDARLWMLQGYKMKAGDYSGDKLPLAAREIVESTTKARKSIAQWNKEGYHENLNSTVDSREILSAAKYVYGKVYASQNVEMPDLVEAGSIDAYTSNFPNLEIVHARHGISLVASTAPKLHTGFGTAVVDKTSLPALRNIGSIRIDADKKPLSFDSLESIANIFAGKTPAQSLSFPKLKKVEQAALFQGTISAPLLESVGNQNPTPVMDTTFSAVVKPDSNFGSLRWTGAGSTMVGRGFTFPSLQVVVGGLHLNDLDASQFPSLEAAGNVYADKPKALEAAPLLNRVGYKITGKKGASISAPGIEAGVKHSGVIKDTILDPEYNANDPRFALKTSVPLISGGEDFLDDQKVLNDIQSGAIKNYSDKDLWMLQGYKMKAGDYLGDSLSEPALEAVATAISARQTIAQWNAQGFYTGATDTNEGEPDYPQDMSGVKYVSGAVSLMQGNHPDNWIAPDLIEANSVYIGYHGNDTVKAKFPKLVKVNDSIEYLGGSINVDLPVLTDVGGRWALAPYAKSKVSAPNLKRIGGADDPDRFSEISSYLPALEYATYAHLHPGADLPNLVSGTVAPQQSMRGINIPKIPPENILEDWLDEEDDFDEDEDTDFSVADRLRTAAPRAQPRSLEDRLTIIERGELKTKLPVWQDLKDWIVKTMIDGTRPFEVWAREFGTPADQAALNQKKSLARTRVAAYISEIDGAYTRPLAAALSEVVSKTKVKDTITAKELVGTWMTVRYAQIKNAEFLQQDQAAVDEAEQAFIAAGGNMVGLRAELQAFSTSTPSATRLTLRSERAAKRFAKASDATRAASRAYVTALTKQEDRLKAVNDPNKNLDPVKTPLDAGLAGGYNNATAAEVQRLIEAKIPRALLDKASAPVYAMIQANTQKDLRNGKISLLAYSKWPAQPLYVPLTGDPRTDDTTSDVFGTGSVNQSKDKRAEGRSSSLAQNGIDAAYEQVGKSSQYHGWLPFKQELTKIYERLLSENNNDASAVYEKYGIKRTRETAMTDLSNSVVFRYGANRSTEGGWAYTFDSVAAIEALRHANVEQRPGWLAPIGWATTTAAKLITQFTPGFAVINAFRDGPERFLNLSTRKLANYPGLNMNKVARDAALVWANPLTIAAARVVLAERLSLPGVVQKVSQSVPDFTPEATKYLREMLGEGASSTTGAYLSRDSGDLAEKLVKINGWPAKTKNMLVVWNDSFELKAPLAMYTALRENGVDKEAAAATVLGTMDFGKAGTAMAPIKALYMFAQPIATGSNELVKTIATTKGKAYAVAMTTAAMGLYAMLSDMAGEDPETKRKRMASISSSTLERSIPVIQPDGTVFKVPVPFGLFQLTWGTGANIMRALNGEQSVAETLGEISKLGFKTFSPISPSETSVARDPLTWAVQTFTPTELKPIANAALNKGAFGGKLDSREFLDPSQPKWKYAKPGTPETYVEASKWLLRNTGMNMSPEVMRELSRVVAVGPLAEVQKGFIDNPHKDALGIKRQSQWFDRYMTTQTPADVVAPPYYHALDQVSDLKKRVEAGERVGDRDRQLLALAKSDETARKSRSQLWSALRKQENGGTIKPEAYRERYQQLKALELQAQRRFLVNFERLTK